MLRVHLRKGSQKVGQSCTHVRVITQIAFANMIWNVLRQGVLVPTYDISALEWYGAWPWPNVLACVCLKNAHTHLFIDANKLACVHFKSNKASFTKLRSTLANDHLFKCHSMCANSYVLPLAPSSRGRRPSSWRVRRSPTPANGGWPSFELNRHWFQASARQHAV